MKIPMSNGFKSNAIFFKLGFLDKTKVSLGMQFKELLSTLWMKAGAIGKCPTIDAAVPDMLILPENKMAVLTDENRFCEFAEQLAKHPEIEVVYLVTDYESSFVAMTQALEGKQTYQLYRDYLDNFRINAGRNSR
jgi:adenine-specific DNA-methyltransferase